MAQVHTFQPHAADAEDARIAVEGALARRLAAAQADREAEAAALRWELRRGSAEEDLPQTVEHPVLSRSQLQAERTANAARLEELRRRLHTAQGQSQALGDRAQLEADLAEKEEQRRSLQAEYDAISLAAQVLETSNVSLQKRFSPALGEKSSEKGSLLPRETFQLSQGTADQLYLAVRLAICDLVLPQEKKAPLVLDDALITFDDGRMEAALTYLVQLARERQILLFTCQHREAAFLRKANASNIHFVEL